MAERSKSKKNLQQEPSSSSTASGSVGFAKGHASASLESWEERNLTRAEEDQSHHAYDPLGGSAPAKHKWEEIEYNRSQGNIISVDIGGEGENTYSYTVPSDLVGHGALLNHFIGISARTLRPDAITIKIKANSPKCKTCNSALRDTIIVPCSHIVLCFGCATQMVSHDHATCPECDMPVREVYRVNNL